MFKSRLKSKSLFRRSSSGPKDQQPSSPAHAQQPTDPGSPQSSSTRAPTVPNSPTTTKKPRQSRSFTSLRERRRRSAAAAVAKETPSPPPPPPQLDKEAVEAALDKEEREKKGGQDASVRAGSESLKSVEGTLLENSVVSLPTVSTNTYDEAPAVVVQEATPGSPEPTNPIDAHVEKTAPRTPVRNTAQQHDDESLTSTSIRKQSLVATADVDVIKALLHDEGIEGLSVVQEAPSLHRGYTSGSGTTALNASMLSRKVWVKRPNQAATIVLIKEDDMVDEAKEAVLSKYRNQLHRHFDAPDITIRIFTRGGPGERILNPDEFLCRTLDSNYPGGQSVDEALLIDVPSRRTPRPSPRAHHSHHGGHHERHAYNNYYDAGSARPHESATDYFPPMPPMNLGQPSPLLTNTSHDSHSHDSRRSHAAHERAMSVLNTGQVPPLPSPGAVSRRAHLAKQHGRPGNARAHTSSPTTLANSVASRASRPRLDSTASTEKHPQLASSTVAIPTPPVPSQAKEIPAITNTQATPNPPTPRVSSPRPSGRSRKTRQKQKDDGPTAMLLPPGILDTAVPPINVLIVEDNMINMRLLEQFVRKLGVRWATAINGAEAVNKWRQGGFHLVLMDIQLPIMSGLEATKEIRRLERVNNIGVFSSASESAPDLSPGDEGGEGEGKGLKDEDKLFEEGYSRLFKSPVIIVALTASNLQSDRHEALAAGCNDFLTKPVNFVWFERKVKEWGCMQALIDFDGWRKWKDFAEANGLKDPSKPAGAQIKPAKKALKPEAATNTAKKAEESKKSDDGASAGGDKKALVVPDPKTLDSKGLDAVGNPGHGEEKGEEKWKAKVERVESEAKDFAKLEGIKGEELAKQDSPDTVIHAPASEKEKEKAVAETSG